MRNCISDTLSLENVDFFRDFHQQITYYQEIGLKCNMLSKVPDGNISNTETDQWEGLSDDDQWEDIFASHPHSTDHVLSDSLEIKSSELGNSTQNKYQNISVSPSFTFGSDNSEILRISEINSEKLHNMSITQGGEKVGYPRIPYESKLIDSIKKKKLVDLIKTPYNFSKNNFYRHN